MRTTHFIKGLLTSGLLALYSAVMAGGGPSKPEAAQFEPIDVSDMVNLFSGDFSYSVPLVEVPGPEGNWPINLAYHAGIGPNTDPTWVGLGWTLNPGAINRFPSGFPDDWYGGMTTSIYQDSGGHESGYGIGFGWGPFGMNLQFVDGKGYQGISGSLRVLGALASIPGVQSFSALANSPFDVSLGFGSKQQGLSVSASLGGGIPIGESGIVLNAGISSSGEGFGAGLGLGMGTGKGTQPLSLAGVSFSSGQNGTSFSMAGTGFSSGSSGPSGGYNVKSNSWGFSIPLPYGFDISLSGYEVKWWLFETQAEGGFGLLHQGGYLGENIKTYWHQDGTAGYKQQYGLHSIDMTSEETETTASSIKTFWGTHRFDRTEIKDGKDKNTMYHIPAEDIYSVNGLGITGSFKAHYQHPFELNGEDRDNPAKFIPINGIYNKKQNIHFRFLGEPGTNFIMNTEDLCLEAYGDTRSYQNYSTSPRQSKYIIHLSIRKPD